ncbi:beta-xylanase [Edaphobacter acidisoli]|uniref:Beta-xylanase n=1 Tax=Edaphobacter acidisoli TaxID=2040573 RepID=A0A916RUT7_9BACT|nr:endo-1,4-beta-xylanase [Edaphobacter acidisoli]GGA68369.1 beta-xylanase [Edaphobacter acidisoli]
MTQAPRELTRREWLKHAAVLAAASSVPGLLAETGDTSDGDEITGAGSLKAHAAARGLLTGCAVNAGLFRSDPAFRKLIAQQYSIVVPENCMKFGYLQPAPNSYNFTDADALVAFAEAHGIKVRGHNFVWHEALPKWFNTTVNKDNARKFLVDHINTVAGRYKGKIHSWDVVNEAIWIKDGRADGLRSSSPWFEMLGSDYLDLAYRTARETDPHALLTYNDYGIEYDTDEEQKKRDAVLGLLRRFKAAGTPIDALGIQSHIHAGGTETYGKGLRRLIDDAGGMGLQVFITEMDVKDDGVASDDIAVRDKTVAEVYGNYLDTVLRGPEVKAVLTWGVTDKNTWLNGGTKFRPLHPARAQRPLPFDADYKPTPAFFAMRKSFDEARAR